jgi:hypothetical protein
VGKKEGKFSKKMNPLELNPAPKLEYPILLRFFTAQKFVNSSLFLQAQQVRSDAT